MNIVAAIKTYRTELMGMAILWVIGYHLHPQNNLLNKLTFLGYGGVDIFFLVSGFGLFYSYHQSKNIVTFWQKRLVRIFPTYLFFVIAFLLLNQKLTFLNFIIHASTLGFWFTSSTFFEWYVPSLVLLYLVSPLFIRLVSFNAYIFAIVTALLTLLFIISWNIWQLPKFQMMCYSRFPIFMLGIYLGYISKQQNYHGVFNFKIIWILMTIMGFAFLCYCHSTYKYAELWTSALYWLPFFIIVPGLMIVCGYLLNFRIDVINIPLEYFGKISYELYLTHVIVFRWLNTQSNSYLNNGICKIALSMIIAALVHHFFAKPIHKLIGNKG